MRCPKCWSTQTKVLDSRFVESTNQIRRRRECEKCWYRFTTFEKISLTDLLVEKKDWTTEYYSRDKLKNSLITAFAKRPISDSEIDKIISELEEKWSSKKKITTKQIWKDILAKLRQIDPVAYVRFASVHLEFESIEDFKKILEDIWNC